MHPAAVLIHGVRVITKRYFAIFCGIYGINDLESCSKVIQGHRFWYQSKVRIHIAISGLGPYLAPFQRYGGLNVENRQFCLHHSNSG